MVNATRLSGLGGRRDPQTPWPEALNSVDVHASRPCKIQRPKDHLKQPSSFTTSIMSLGVMSPLSDIHDDSPGKNLAFSHRVNRACQGCARLATLPETLIAQSNLVSISGKKQDASPLHHFAYLAMHSLMCTWKGDMRRPVCGLCQRTGVPCEFPLRRKRKRARQQLVQTRQAEFGKSTSSVARAGLIVTVTLPNLSNDSASKGEQCQLCCTSSLELIQLADDSLQHSMDHSPPPSLSSPGLAGSYTTSTSPLELLPDQLPIVDIGIDVQTWDLDLAEFDQWLPVSMEKGDPDVPCEELFCNDAWGLPSELATEL